MILAYVRSCIGREWTELEFGDVVGLPIKRPHDLEDYEDEEEVWQSSSKLEDCQRPSYDMIARSSDSIIEMYDLSIRSLALIHRTLEQNRITDRLIFRLKQDHSVGAIPPYLGQYRTS